MRLLRGRVRIKPDDEERVTRGGIIVPDNVRTEMQRDRKKARTGVVLAMGAPALDKRGREVPPGFVEGQRVYYQYGQISSDGVDAWCSQAEVIAVIEESVN
jgi:co-chaperonin GroES (HSP10)